MRLPHLARALAILIALLLAPATPRAEPLVADLSSHLVAITTGFAGTEVLLYGATEGVGEVVVVVRGPARDVVVRRADRVAGIWMNVEQARFPDVPVFYAMAASGPLDEFLPLPTRERHQIGLPWLNLATPDMTGADARMFREALIRGKQREGLYGIDVGTVRFLGDRLFRTLVTFPSNVPTGVYTVDVYLIQDGQAVGAQTTPLVVGKVGLGAQIFDLAHTHAAPYGVFAVLIAALAGWIAGMIFRKG